MSFKKQLLVIFISTFTSLNCVRVPLRTSLKLLSYSRNLVSNSYNAAQNSYAYLTTTSTERPFSDAHLRPLYFKPLEHPIPTDLSTLKLINEIHNNYENMEPCTLDINDTSWHICSPPFEIQSDTLIVHAPGRRSRAEPARSKEELKKQPFGGDPQRGGSALTLVATLKQRALPTLPCITFDVPCYRHEFDCAQDLQLRSLETIIQKADAKNIIVNSVCLGSSVFLRMLTKSDPMLITPIRAAILQSPPLSLKDVTQQLTTSYTSWLPYSDIIFYKFFKALHPNYLPAKDNLLNLLKNSSVPMPLLIAHIKGDAWISDESIYKLVDTLKQKNSEVYLLILEEDPTNLIRHGILHKSETFGNTVHAFLKAYDLPHNADQASQGIESLRNAQLNVFASSIKEWIISPLQ